MKICWLLCAVIIIVAKCTAQTLDLHANNIKRILANHVYRNTASIDGTNIMNYLLGREVTVDNKLANFNLKNLSSLLQDASDTVFSNRNQTMRLLRLDHDFLSITGQELLQKLNRTRKTPAKTRRTLQDPSRTEADKLTREADLNVTQKDYRKRYLGREWFRQMWLTNNDPSAIYLMKNLMMQSVYQTRMNLKKTWVLRRLYAGDTSYQIGQLTAVLQENLWKIRKMHATCHEFGQKTRNRILDKFKESSNIVYFLNILVLYEKALAAHTDISFYMRRIIDLHQTFVLSLQESDDDDPKKKKKKKKNQ